MNPIDPQVGKNYEDFWMSRNDRGIMYLTYGKPGEGPARFLKPWMPEGRGWNIAVSHEYYMKTGDLSRVTEALDYVEGELDAIGYAAEGYRGWWYNLGPGVVAAFLSGFSRFAEHSVWFELDKPMEYSAIKAIDPQAVNRVARCTREVAEMIVKRFGGNTIISQTDLGGVVDILASLRRTGQLLLDCADSPEEIVASLPVIEQAWKNHFAYFDRLFSAANAGWRSTWIPILSGKPFYSSQCDFCFMISPSMFRELVLPSLSREAEFLGRVVYHLDGPGEVPHLDMLCSIPEIKVIQWTSGAGEAEVWDEKWHPLYKRIIDHGKKILLFYHGDEALVRKLYTKFPAKEFCLVLHAPGEKQARIIESLR